MFRFARRSFQAAPKFRRGLAITGTVAIGIAATSSAVAFAASPYSVTDREVATAVPSLTPRDLSEPTSFEQAKKEADAAEADQQKKNGEQRQAYNPETGEIDWDCPCLGGMAHGPCGEEFKEAFACFVYSTSEIRGSECIPKFSEMQGCFRKYPEVYAEFNDDTDTVAEAEKSNQVEGAKEAVSAEISEKTQQATEKIDEVKGAAKQTADNAKEAVKSSLASEPVTDAIESAKSTGAELAEAASDAASKTADAVQTKSADYKEKLQKKLQETGLDSVDAASEAASKAADVVKSKTAEYMERLQDAGIESADALSEYATQAQAAAREVLADAKKRAEGLSSSQVAEEIEKKLKELHETASDIFSNTEKNQSAFRQTQKFATGAVAGIAAEAKEAVNYVSTQLSSSNSNK